MRPAEIIRAAVAISGVLITVVGGIFTYLNNRRAQFERVLAETENLTSGETRKARHRIGALLEGQEAGVVDLHNDQTAAYLDVLWAFERLYALYVSLRFPFGIPHITRPQVLLLLTSRGAIKTWTRYASRVDEDTAKHASNEGLRRLTEELSELERTGRT